eukprot:g2928.t1
MWSALSFFCGILFLGWWALLLEGADNTKENAANELFSTDLRVNISIQIDEEARDTNIYLNAWFGQDEVDVVLQSFCENRGVLQEDCKRLQVEAYARMREARKRVFSFQDWYNEGVFHIHSGDLERGLSIWTRLLRARRGVPFNEYVLDAAAVAKGERVTGTTTTRGDMFRQYVRERADTFVASGRALLRHAWNAGKCASLERVPNQYRPHPFDVKAKGSAFVTSREKIRHDCEQIELLVAREKLPKSAISIVAEARKILATLPDGTDYFILSDRQFDRVGVAFQTLLYYPAASLPTQLVDNRHDVLGSNVEWAAVERAYYANDAQVVSADGVLSPTTLARLLAFCEEATIFYDVKPGYLGAYMNEGFAHPLLLRVAEALREKMPRLLGPHKLTQMWAYKYTSTGGRGIKVHADPAKVNLNLWLTSDDAREPSGGGAGLVVYLREPPASWSPRQANDFQFENEIMAFVRDAPSRRFEYKQNRFVMFNSKLFHKTDDFRFRDCYTCRRINLTFLFGAP